MSNSAYTLNEIKALNILRNWKRNA